MSFTLSNFDQNGNPTHVSTNDGFIQCSRPFNPDADGWMLNQLNVSDFPIIQAARDMEEMIYEINALRRQVYELKQSERRWMSAAGFGPKPAPYTGSDYKTPEFDNA